MRHEMHQVRLRTIVRNYRIYLELQGVEKEASISSLDLGNNSTPLESYSTDEISNEITERNIQDLITLNII